MELKAGPRRTQVSLWLGAHFREKVESAKNGSREWSYRKQQQKSRKEKGRTMKIN